MSTDNQSLFDSNPILLLPFANVAEAWISCQGEIFFRIIVPHPLGLLVFQSKVFFTPASCLSTCWPVVGQTERAWTQLQFHAYDHSASNGRVEVGTQVWLFAWSWVFTYDPVPSRLSKQRKQQAEKHSLINMVFHFQWPPRYFFKFTGVIKTGLN